MWYGDYATYYVEVVITIKLNLYCCYAEGLWFDSLFS